MHGESIYIAGELDCKITFKIWHIFNFKKVCRSNFSVFIYQLNDTRLLCVDTFKIGEGLGRLFHWSLIVPYSLNASSNIFFHKLETIFKNKNLSGMVNKNHKPISSLLNLNCSISSWFTFSLVQFNSSFCLNISGLILNQQMDWLLVPITCENLTVILMVIKQCFVKYSRLPILLPFKRHAVTFTEASRNEPLYWIRQTFPFPKEVAII